MNLITLSLSAEFLSIDSENRLFDLIQNSQYFKNSGLIDRSSYHRRRKHLYPTFKKLLEYLAGKIVPDEDTFIVDSIPVEVCRFARARRTKKRDQINPIIKNILSFFVNRENALRLFFLSFVISLC